MVDFSKKHNIDGLTVYSKPGTKVPGLTPVKTSREEVEKETVNIEEINRRLQKASPTSKRKVSKRKVLITIGIIVAILALGGLGVWFVIKKPTFLGSKVDFEIRGPKTIASGETFSYEFLCNNKEEVSIENIEIEVIYPQGFIFISSDPEVSKEHTWVIDKIEARSEKKVIVSGQLIGESDQDKEIRVNFSYKPQNVSSRFSQEKKLITKISTYGITLAGDLAENIPQDSEIEWIIKYGNITKNAISEIMIEVEYPDGFEFSSSDPEPFDDNNVWSDLRVTEECVLLIRIKGTLSGEPNESKIFKANLSLVAGGQTFPQQKIESKVKLIKTEIEISHSVDKKIASPGEEIEFTTKIKNTSDVTFENVVVNNDLDLDIVNGGSIEAVDGKITSEKIFWSKDTLESLASLEPDQEVTISLKARIKEAIEVSKTEDKNFVLKNKVMIEADVEEIHQVLGESSETETKIVTSLSLRSEGHYADYEGRQVGSGPIPPKVGKTTSYVIYWHVSNKTNDAEKVKVTAVLPKGVKWTGKTTVSDGTISFDSKTRKITWNIGDIPANSGSLLSGLEATFEISITPKALDVGKILPLLGETTILGTDSFCNIEVSDSAEAITTDLKYDVEAKGEGKVVK